MAYPYSYSTTGASKDSLPSSHKPGDFASQEKCGRSVVAPCMKVLRPMATDDRLVLPFRGSRFCCAVPAGLPLDIPRELQRAGVPSGEWLRFAERLAKDVQPLAFPVTCIPFAFIPYTMPLVAPLLCCLEARYQAALGAWLGDFNAEVLAPRGLLAVFQTNAIRDHCCGIFSDVSWLAVALTAKEAAVLAAEPLLWTPVSVASCCGDGSLKPHPCPCGVSLGCCGVPCVV